MCMHYIRYKKHVPCVVRRQICIPSRPTIPRYVQIGEWGQFIYSVKRKMAYVEGDHDHDQIEVAKKGEEWI